MLENGRPSSLPLRIFLLNTTGVMKNIRVHSWLIWAFCASRTSDSLANGMAERAQRRKALTAANGRLSKASKVSDGPTFERADLLILFGLAAVTFGIYAQVIGHR